MSRLSREVIILRGHSAGVTQLSQNKVCHDQDHEVYQEAYMKYTCDCTILLDWVATNAQIKEAKQNFTDTDYTFTLQPSAPWQMNYTPRDYEIIVTRLMPKNYLKPQGHQKKLQKSGWSSKQALCKFFLPKLNAVHQADPLFLLHDNNNGNINPSNHFIYHFMYLN